MNRLIRQSLFRVARAGAFGMLCAFIGGCSDDKPPQIDYSPRPNGPVQDFTVPVAEWADSSVTPAKISQDNPVAAKAILSFMGELRAGDSGVALPGSFVVELNREGLTHASGSADALFRGKSVVYKITLNAPARPGRYTIEISAPSKTGKVIIAKGEVEVI